MQGKKKRDDDGGVREKGRVKQKVWIENEKQVYRESKYNINKFEISLY